MKKKIKDLTNEELDRMCYGHRCGLCPYDAVCPFGFMVLAPGCFKTEVDLPDENDT